MSEQLCIYCDGSGEGMMAGSRCFSCKGIGIELDLPEHDEYDEDDMIYNKDSL